jgi:hypothetical protein
MTDNAPTTQQPETDDIGFRLDGDTLDDAEFRPMPKFEAGESEK